MERIWLTDVEDGLGLTWVDEKGGVNPIEYRLASSVEKRNSRAKETKEWIPVSERLPELGQSVWVFTDEGETSATYENKRYGDKKPFFNVITMGVHGCGCCGGEYPIVTHWQHLPEPPKENNELD